MTSSGISTLILLIAGLIIAASASAIAIDVASDINQGIEQRGEQVSNSISTDVRIVSSPEFVYDSTNNELSIFIKNTGKNNVRIDKQELNNLNFFVDGNFLQPDSVVFSDSSGSPWKSSEIIRADFNIDLSSGDRHTVSVIVRQNRDSITFFVD